MNRKYNVNDTRTFLVIGGSGKTGSLVCEGLAAEGCLFRMASRNSPVKFDWYDETTWTPSLEGVDSIYVTFYPDLAVPAAPGIISKFLKLAKHMKIEHVVMLSGRGEDAAQECEKILAESGINWNVVRASWFNQNFSEGAFSDFINAGQIALPVSEVGEPFVDTTDIADVAVKCLLHDEMRNQLFEVTGPEVLSFKKVAEVFSEELDRKIGFQQVSMDDFVDGSRVAGIPEDALEMLQYLFNEVLDGRNEYLTTGVFDALGREPKSFQQFVADNVSKWEK